MPEVLVCIVFGEAILESSLISYSSFQGKAGTEIEVGLDVSSPDAGIDVRIAFIAGKAVLLVDVVIEYGVEALGPDLPPAALICSSKVELCICRGFEVGVSEESGTALDISLCRSRCSITASDAAEKHRMLVQVIFERDMPAEKMVDLAIFIGYGTCIYQRFVRFLLEPVVSQAQTESPCIEVSVNFDISAHIK